MRPPPRAALLQQRGKRRIAGDPFGGAQLEHAQVEIRGERLQQTGNRRGQHCRHVRDGGDAKMAVVVVQRALNFQRNRLEVACRIVAAGERVRPKIDAPAEVKLAAARNGDESVIGLEDEEHQTELIFGAQRGEVALCQFGNVDDVEIDAGLAAQFGDAPYRPVACGDNVHRARGLATGEVHRGVEYVERRFIDGKIQQVLDAPADGRAQFFLRHRGRLGSNHGVFTGLKRQRAACVFQIEIRGKAHQDKAEIRDVAGGPEFAGGDARRFAAGSRDAHKFHPVSAEPQGGQVLRSTGTRKRGRPE
jgi:hypothetical protein